MKHFIEIKDISAKDIRSIIENSKKRKKDRSNYRKETFFKNKLMIILMEKPSLRTRMSLLGAAYAGGGRAITLRSDEIHLGSKGESIKDTAEILSRSGDLFVFRTTDHDKVLEFKKHLSIPLICGLSNKAHALQVVSDVQYIEDTLGKNISKIAVSWIGDGNNNVINSLIEISAKLNFKLNIGCPKKYEPNKNLLSWVRKNKGKIKIFNDIKKAATGSDVLFTDKVISMNDKVNKSKKLKDFKKFKVTSKVMSYLKPNGIFLHCLPRGTEVSNEVFLSKQSKVWQQALNRIYVQKSILLYCFEKLW